LQGNDSALLTMLQSSLKGNNIYSCFFLDYIGHSINIQKNTSACCYPKSLTLTQQLFDVHRGVLPFPPITLSHTESFVFSSSFLSISFPGGIHKNMATRASERDGSAMHTGQCRSLPEGCTEQRELWTASAEREPLTPTKCRSCSLYDHRLLHKARVVFVLKARRGQVARKWQKKNNF